MKIRSLLFVLMLFATGCSYIGSIEEIRIEDVSSDPYETWEKRELEKQINNNTNRVYRN